MKILTSWIKSLPLSLMLVGGDAALAAITYTATPVMDVMTMNDNWGMEPPSITNDGHVWGMWTAFPLRGFYLGSTEADTYEMVIGGLQNVVVKDGGRALLTGATGFNDPEVVYYNGQQETWITGPWGRVTLAVDFNASGQIVGNASFDDTTEFKGAWLYTNGQTQVLNGLSSAVDIDEQGRVLGWSNEAGHTGELALWDAGVLSYGGLALPPPPPTFDVPLLSDVVANVGPLPGQYAQHHLVEVSAANAAGQLAALACTETAWCVALRLDPIPAVPEPSTAAGFLAGAAALCAAGRRRMRKA
jgi:hypothetical protein